MARIRTFIAVGLDKSVRERTVSLQEALAATGTEVKWVEPENLHLTLLFLGEVDDRDLVSVCRVVAECSGRVAPFVLGVQGAGCFPNPRRPRTLWVGVGAGTQELVLLHDALEAPLLELGCYRREERQYTPHLTLGRVKSDLPGDKLAAALAKHAGWRCGEMPVREVLVMSSELTSQGPVYTVMGRGKLGTEV
jgi:2'-5' RNA ligase